MRFRERSFSRDSILSAVIALLLLLVGSRSFAQPVLSKQRILAGGFIGYQGNFYSGSFNIFPPPFTDQCGVFASGSGWKPSFGVTFEYPLSKKLNIAPRLYWDNRSGTFTVTHTDNAVLSNGVPTEIDAEFDKAMTLRQFSLDVPLKWMPFKRNNLFFLGGASLGFIINNRFHQSESIISPSNAYFTSNNRQDRVLADGMITGVQRFQYGMCLGVGYDVPVSKEMFLAPEITNVLGFTNVVNSPSWTIVALRFSVALKGDITSMFRDEAFAEPIIDQSAAQINANERTGQLPTATASIQVMGIMPDGDQTPHPTLKVEEFISTDLQPVLNYIFFDDNSAEIPKRYVRLTPDVAATYTDTGMIGSGTMELYANTLNILGRRMVEHETAKLRIIGCNSNEGTETGNLALSKARADAVYQYMTTVWKIDSARIFVNARNLPDEPSRAGTSFGAEENRRAELQCDDPAVLSPITLSGLERTSTPPRIRMYMRSEHPDLIDHWHAEAIENGKVIAHTEGVGKIPTTFDWILSKLADTLIHGEEPVHFSLTVVDSAGTESRTEAQIQLKALTLRKKREQRIADKRIDKFSLFLFDFDQSKLSTQAEAILSMVEKAVQPTSDVEVIGFTDRTGEAEHNKSLSEDRARAVADHIAAHAHPAHIHDAGRGDMELLFDNALPEGRYFSRTVYVRVETPVGEGDK